MRDSHESDAQFLSRFVHDALDLEGHARGALVQDGEFGPMVEQSRHSDSLLQTAGEDVAPFFLGVPSARTVGDVVDFNDGEDVVQVGVGDALCVHLAQSVRVDDLLAEGTARQVRALWDVEDFVEAGLFNGAAVDGPQAAEDAEERGFAASVGADDEEVVAGVDGEGEFAD